jgi:hypothetical protein
MRVSLIAGVLGSIFVYTALAYQKPVILAKETSKPIVANPTASAYASIAHLPIAKHISHIEKRCNARGWGEQCVRDTIALAKQESLGGRIMVGDKGLSHGWYHIQIKLHGITKEQANDIVFATDWVHDRWEKLGYPVFRSKALASHNCPACGYSGAGKMYARSVKLKSASLIQK